MTQREYPERPIVGVGTVIVGPLGVILIKRGKPPRAGSWSLPGGAQKLGETVEECAAREVLEETGLQVSLIGLVEVVNSIQRDGNDRPRFHYTLVDFAATVSSGELAAGGDAADVRWFTPEEIDGLELWSETERVIRKARRMYSHQQDKEEPSAFLERRPDGTDDRLQ